MIKIALPNYTNSLPFLEGLNQLPHNQYQIITDWPSKIADLLRTKQIDIGLVPSIFFTKADKDIKIIDDYCIGSNKKVASVCLVSNSPIHNISKIFLDRESNSSNQLLSILLKEFWKKKVTLDMKENNNLDTFINDDEGALVIGDKAFQEKKKFRFIYDLAEEWYHFMKLPFVFAVWGVHKNIVKQGLIDELKSHFKTGIHNYLSTQKHHNDYFDVHYYLNQNISFTFDEVKKKSLELFLYKSSNDV